MKLTIDLNEIGKEKAGELLILLGILDATVKTPEDTPAETEPKPVKESQPAKRTRTAKTKEAVEETETASEETNDTEPVPTQPEEVTEPSTPSKTSLSELKDYAQSIVKKVDRQKIKDTIGKYAERLTDVKQSDYSALMSDLKSLEG